MSDATRNKLVPFSLALISSLPAVVHALSIFVPSIGLVWLGIYTLLLSPISWSKLSIFQVAENHLQVPSVPATVVGCVLYTLVSVVIWRLYVRAKAT